MKKLLPWVAGVLIGLFLSVFTRSDPSYELVATSWGTPVDSPDLWIYQIQVIARDRDSDGKLEVSAKGCIGSSDYYHDFGVLGSADDMGDAVRKFGDIRWEANKVTIGGASGVVASVSRSQLGRHR